MIAQRVIALLEADLATGGIDLLDVRVFQGGGRYQIRVFVDLLNAETDLDAEIETEIETESDTEIDTANAAETSGRGREGIALDQVAKASRTVGMLLEEADLFADQYVIEVSSPGIRRPLRKSEHYRLVIGEKVDLKVMGTGSQRVRGVLEGLEEGPDGVELIIQTPAPDADSEAISVRVKLHRVLEGNLDPEFDAQAIINSDRRERKDTKRQVRREKAAGKKKGRPKNRLKDRTKNDGGSTS